MDAMSMMADLCLTVDKNNAKGGKTLSLLHEKCVLQARFEFLIICQASNSIPILMLLSFLAQAEIQYTI
jgi:hypothetical protein